ncbi:TPA: hypothetical protein ACLFL5_004206, partial [Salmonella enterica subsp. houtenae serovar Houten]
NKQYGHFYFIKEWSEHTTDIRESVGRGVFPDENRYSVSISYLMARSDSGVFMAFKREKYVFF